MKGGDHGWTEWLLLGHFFLIPFTGAPGGGALPAARFSLASTHAERRYNGQPTTDLTLQVGIERVSAKLPSMILTLPDEPALESFDESELKLELAVALFSSARVSRSVAASIAGMDRFAFDEELFRRRIPSFTAEMLEQDLASLPSRLTA